ncbi:MAG: hypothetical protein WDZ77_01960 [Candidatus Pacearchaeota archaeon]
MRIRKLRDKGSVFGSGHKKEWYKFRRWIVEIIVFLALVLLALVLCAVIIF